MQPTPLTADRLKRLSHRRTRYELTATHPDGRRVLLCYSPRRNRTGLFHAIADNDDRRAAVIALVGTDKIEFGDRAADGATMGDWAIRWTGRTQREAIIDGELPYVEDLP